MSTNISGFPELMPGEQIAFNRVVAMVQAQLELHGFTPLDTPAVERVATLLSKGNDNEIYGLHRLADKEGKKEGDIALRFDLTVPLVRYVVQHYGQLTFPYRRYHIAPVWRGERPQVGRYRQFHQCDIDIIADGDLPLTCDAEVLSVICTVFRAMNLRFVMKVNNRYLLSGLIKSLGLIKEDVPAVMRVIDKADKITKEALIKELHNCGVTHKASDLLCDLIANRMSNTSWFEYLQNICDHEEFITGLAELRELFNLLQLFGIADQEIRIDPTLARGLDYYTGTVAEVVLPEYMELGSVGGGGRYLNLASNFGDKKLPGVGFSIGLSRLLHRLIGTGKLQCAQETPAMVLVTIQNNNLLSYYIEIATQLRNNGIKTEIYLSPKSLSAQMKYASKKGFRFAIIANEQETTRRELVLRSMADGKQETVSLEVAIELIKASAQ